MKQIFMAIGAIVLVGGIVISLKGRTVVQNGQLNLRQNGSSLISSVSNSPGQSFSAPLPQETDIIRTFFQLISEKKISEAVSMMNNSITQNDSQKQAWGVQLNAFESVKVLAIEQSMPQEWNDTRHSYQVVLDVVMSPDSSNAPIPYYGYDKGTNTRWIVLEKSGNKWNVAEIATGP